MKELRAEAVETVVRSLLEAQQTALGIEVTTPVLYPNGDYVAVIVACGSDGLVVHDASLGIMHIAAGGTRVNREMAGRLRASAERYECQMIDGRVMRTTSDDEIAISVLLVANASRAVSDHAIEIRRQNESDFRYVVTQSLRELAGERLKENESFKGRSGRTYRVQNLILDQKLQRPLVFAVPLASRSAVPSQFRELFDLKAAYSSVRNESIYDDEGDFRPDEDGWLLEQVGDVVPISEIKTRIAPLLAAA